MADVSFPHSPQERRAPVVDHGARQMIVEDRAQNLHHNTELMAMVEKIDRRLDHIEPTVDDIQAALGFLNRLRKLALWVGGGIIAVGSTVAAWQVLTDWLAARGKG